MTTLVPLGLRVLRRKVLHARRFESQESVQGNFSVCEPIAGLAGIQSLLDRGEHQASGGRR